MAQNTKYYSIFLGICLMVVAQGVLSANILGISPLTSTSHYNVIQPVFQELARRGHNITVITPMKDDFYPPNYRRIEVDRFEPGSIFKNGSKTNNLFDILQGSTLTNSLMILELMSRVNEITLSSKGLHDFIENDKSHFDLVICEDFNMNPYYMFVHKYNAPLVTFQTLSGAHYVNDFMGNPLNLHYVSHEIMGKVGKLTLWDKIENILVTLITQIARVYYYMPKHNELARKYFGHLEPLPDLREIEKNISLVFMNSHFSFDVVKPYLPNIVEFGGVHVKDPKPLPKDLLSIMDNATNGVIYFSMGSNLKSKDMPEEKVKSLLEVFSKLKETILWKWENESLPGKPKNVIIRQWFPQTDILAHPNLKLFITHGGLLSIIETVYRGVPLLGIPILADQPANIEKAKSYGFAESIDYKHLNVDNFGSIIDILLNDPKYKSRAKELSALVNDKPLSAMETTMFWIDYVIRHQGAYHMKSPSSFMTWHEYYLVDVFVVLGVITVSLLYIIYLIILVISHLVFGKSGIKKVSEKKRN